MPVDEIPMEKIVQFEIACLWVQKEKLIGKQVMNFFKQTRVCINLFKKDYLNDTMPINYL